MSRLSNRTLLFFVLAAVSLALLVASSTGRLAPAEGVLMQAARPFLTAFNNLGRQASNIFTTARDLATLRSRNQQLQTQADTLTIDNLRLKEVEAENTRLRELLRFAQINPLSDYRGGQVIARVISRPPTNYLTSLHIDLGSQHGIKPGMPVVTEKGLVGRIQKVGPVSSIVLPITDPSGGVQAMVKRSNSRAVGVVTGQAGALPVMEFISQDADISLGDEIMTSGLGGAFPKGITIGQVVAINKRDYDMFQQATIRPTVNFNQLEFVLVITNFQPIELEGVG